MRPRELEDGKKLWQGTGERFIYNENTSIGEILFNSMSAFPSNICQIHDSEDGPQIMTNREALLKAFAVAKFIDEIDLRQDRDVITVISPNTMNILPVVLGAFFKAIPISPMFTDFQPTVFKHILRITAPKLIFVDQKNFENIAEIVEELNFHQSVVIVNTESQHMKNILQKSITSFNPDPLRRDSHQTAAIVCSSGTTGLPKAICLSHKCFHMKVNGNITSEDVLLCFSHLFWISGLYQLVTSLTTGATRIITKTPFSGGYFLDLVEKYKPTYVMSSVPQLLQVIKDESLKFRDLSSIRSYIVSGDHIPQNSGDFIERLLTNGRLFVGYGMTEGECAGTLNCSRNTHPTSVGKPGSNSMFKIVDEEGNSLPENEQGEVCFRRIDKVFGGYYRDPEATNKICDREGFLHSKDLGYFDSEGYLYIVGRMTDIFKSRGREYTPFEIERSVLEIPGVFEVCAFGVTDGRSSEVIPGALVVKSRDCTLEESDITAYIERNTVMNLRGGVFFVDEIPRTSTDKYMRRAALEMFNRLRRIEM
ncbi:hypothetical protein ACFFRR_001585 [Megaselia abdita]